MEQEGRAITGVGIAYGIIDATTIAACVHMIDQGYAWWQVLLMAALGYAMLPNYRRVTVPSAPTEGR